jgi:hypothetical protein
MFGANQFGSAQFGGIASNDPIEQAIPGSSLARLQAVNLIHLANLIESSNIMIDFNRTLRDRLAGYYHLADTLSAIGGAAWTNEGSAFAAGKVGDCVVFDGSGDWVLDIDSTLFGYGTTTNGSPVFTGCLWIKPGASGQTASVLERANVDTVTDDGEWYLRLVAGKLRFGSPGSGQGNGYVESLAALTSGNWYFIVFGMIENDGLFLDINNVRQAQNQLTTNAPNSNAPLSLSNGLGGSLNASIDELGFWDRSLDSTEKEWLYNTGAGRAFPL